MAIIALAAVRPLLGLILSEAQLLRGVRDDVQFISDEMDSIKGFLIKLAGTKEGAGDDHQVRAWMAQVMEIAYVSTNCIQDYALCGGQARPGDRRGLLGRLRRAARFPKCILVRYRVATRIRRLRVRVLEVSARQQRYAVVVPPRKDPGSGLAVLQADQIGGGDRERRHFLPDAEGGSRRAPMLAAPDMLMKSSEELTRWLNDPSAEAGEKWPRVLAIISPDGIKEEGTPLPDQLYNKFRSMFDLTARVSIQRPARISHVMLDMCRQLIPEDACQPMENGRPTIPQLWPRTIPPPLKGKRLLVVLSGLEYPDEMCVIKSALDNLECSAGSAIVLCTKVKEVASGCSPHIVLSLIDLYAKEILSLDLANIKNLEDKARRHAIVSILNRCNPNIHCMNLFLQALYKNPYRTELELKTLYESLDPSRRSSDIEMRSLMMKFCFQGLPQAYKNCLWYSAIFTRGSYKTRRSSLVRRWVAEALIDKAGRYSAIDEAEHCFDVLSTQKLLIPCDIDGAGKIKSCAVDPLVISMLKETIRVEDFLDPNLLPTELSLHFSIRNGIYLHQFNRLVSKQENITVDRQMKSIMKFLKMMTASSSFRHLQVLDLEGYKGFKKRHLKNICKIHQLRYLNLRDTDISQLPKEMDKLLHLETLDIRGTRVRAFNTVVPTLKHLFAGHTRFARQGDSTVKSNKEFFSTVHMSRDVTRMENLEVLSHVKLSSNTKELKDVCEKLKLKKLGVVLHGKNTNLLIDLFIEIGKLSRVLGSLSICVEVPVHWDVINDIFFFEDRCHQ
jgi:hypothetical protein